MISKEQQEKHNTRENPEFWDLILRPFSRPITQFLVKFTKITPNQITWVSLLIGIIASYFVLLEGKENLFIGAFLVLIFIILDNVDGEVARLRKKSSNLGKWFDGITGFIVNELLIIAIALGIGTTTALTIGLFTMIAFPMQYTLIYFYKSEIVKNNLPIQITKSGAINKIKYLYGSTFFQFLVVLGCLFNKLIWVLLFFAVFGNLFWIGTVIVQYLNLRK